jgi:hypothetical protein
MKNFFKDGQENTMITVGSNLIVMVIYTLLSRLNGRDGSIEAAIFLALHILVCLIISPFTAAKAFLLSALALLLIGFSTCVLVYTI